MEEGNFKILTGKPTGKRRLEGQKQIGRLYQNGQHQKEIGMNTRNWVDWAQDRDYWRALVNAVL